jgi:secreted trypsin-like serine protease
MSKHLSAIKNLFLMGLSFLILCVTFVSVVPAGAVVSSSSDASGKEFFGGEVSSSSSYPWMVALLSSDEPDTYLAQFCGGSLIAVDLVITAAHCVDTLEEVSEIEVVVGAFNLYEIKPEDKQKVSKIIIHKDWNFDTTKNDIAILRLSDRTRNIGVPLINLQDQNNKVLQGDYLKVLGWGESAPDVFPSVLHEGDVSVGASPFSSRCEKWQVKDYDRLTMMCASGFNSPTDIVDTCFGDSGGPLFRSVGETIELVGITSWGADDCPKSGYPGLYTRISNYLSWIEKKTSPKILSLDEVDSSEGSFLRINGRNFFTDEILSVRVAGVETSFEVLSSSRISAALPEGVSSGLVVIRSDDGKTVSPKRFTTD